MNKTNLVLFFCLTTFFYKPSIAQLQSDTLVVMNYNVGNYGFPATGSCPLLSPALKHAYLRTIMQYIAPDIVALVKMNGTPTGFSTTTVIDSVLNVGCPGCYAHCDFTNVSGYSKVNMLYYKSSKLGFIGTTTIYSSDSDISDINLHKLFYKSPNLAITNDTVFINVIVVHLVSGASHASDRHIEMSGAMAWLNANVTTACNYIIMGDFNTQNSTEACFQDMISSPNLNTKYYDPPSQLGDWSGLPNLFSNYLTQSTRTSDPGDCNATGGMDSRFDHILCTQPIIAGAKSVLYIPSSYKVIGQDGLHTNVALIDAPVNISAPSTVIDALYYMSEHLPEVLNLQVSYTLTSGINETTGDLFNVYPTLSATGIFQISLSHDNLFTITVYNAQGEKIFKTKTNNQQTTLNLSKQPKGIYLIQIADHKKNITNKKIIIQ